MTTFGLRVAVIESQVLFAKALCGIFADDSDFKIVGDYRTPAALQLKAVTPDLIVIDLDGQPVVDVNRPVNQLGPDRLDQGLELVSRGLLELGRGVADEVLPELAGRFLDGWAGLEPHQRFVEPLGCERPFKGLLDHEDDSRTTTLEGGGDTDAVVGRPVSPFREKDDGRVLPFDLRRIPPGYASIFTPCQKAT